MMHCLYSTVGNNFEFLVKILMFHHLTLVVMKTVVSIKTFFIFFFFLTWIHNSCEVIFLLLFVFGVAWLSYWSSKFLFKPLFLNLVV